jgi:hypothetical protein
MERMTSAGSSISGKTGNGPLISRSELLVSNFRTVLKQWMAMKSFTDLTEREVLAVAISSEEEDGRIYMSFTEDLKER